MYVYVGGSAGCALCYGGEGFRAVASRAPSTGGCSAAGVREADEPYVIDELDSSQQVCVRPEWIDTRETTT